MCTQYWKRRLHFIFSECDISILLAGWVCLSSQINNQLSSPTFPYIFQLRSTSIIFSESKADSLHKNIQIAAALATLLRLQFELFSTQVPVECRRIHQSEDASEAWILQVQILLVAANEWAKISSAHSAATREIKIPLISLLARQVWFLSIHSPLTTSFSSI